MWQSVEQAKWRVCGADSVTRNIAGHTNLGNPTHVDAPTPNISYQLLIKIWKDGLCLGNPVISSACGPV